MKYQYTSSGFKQDFNRSSLSMPAGVKLLLIVNIGVFILIEISGHRSLLFNSFGLIPISIWRNYKFWQFFTYLFIHGGIFHIFFNMFVLWMFGKDLENRWGKIEFLFFYFLCGIGSGVVTVFFSLHSSVPIVGASGAIYGLLIAYGFTYPNRMVYLYGLLPIRVKYMVLSLGVIAFFASLSASKSNISHITHLSGMIIGFLLIYCNITWNKVVLWNFQLLLKNVRQRPNNRKNDEKIKMKQKVDKILDKLNTGGWESLSLDEEKELIRASKKWYSDKTPN